MTSRRAVVIVVLGLLAGLPGRAAEEARRSQLREVRTLPISGEKVRVLGFSPDGQRLLTACDDAFVVWDVKLGKRITRFRREGKTANYAAFFPDGKTAVASFWNEKEVILFDTASGRVSSRIAQPATVEGLAVKPDGKFLVAHVESVGLWDSRTGMELRRMHLRTSPGPDNHGGWGDGDGPIFSPDCKLLAVPESDSSVHLCDVETGANIRRLFRPSESHFVPRLAFSPDGRFLAVHSQELVRVNGEPDIRRSLIRLWDVRNGEIVREFRHRDPLRPSPSHQHEWDEYRAGMSWWSSGMRFSPDVKTLVNTSFFETQLWEVASGRLRHTLHVSTRTAWFSPDGALLATAIESLEEKGTRPVLLWDWRDLCLKQPKVLSERDIDRLWDDLASTDAPIGYRAMATFLVHTESAVPALATRLKRVEPVAPTEVDRLVRSLDADDFSVREQASKRLAGLGEAARPALLRMKSQQPSPELARRIGDLLVSPLLPTRAEQLRCLRAVEILESIGTEEARRAIRKLAGEKAGGVEVEDAKAALKRLERR